MHPVRTDFHTRCKYENNTSPCGRWHAMFSQALHKAKGGGGGLTPPQQWFAVFAASESTIALSPGSFYLATACQCAWLPPALLSPPKQKGWLITPSCCMPIKYYYSCFVFKKKRTGEKLRRVPGNVCGFGTSVKDLCPWLLCYCLKTSLQQPGNANFTVESRIKKWMNSPKTFLLCD